MALDNMRSTPTWVLTPADFLSEEEARQLRQATAKAASRSRDIKVRDWFLIDLAMSSGMRVSELAALQVRDLPLRDPPAVRVQVGKGGKGRLVLVDSAIMAHAQRFLAWKQARGEPLDDESPVFWSRVTGGSLSDRALQKAFKRCAAPVGLAARFSIHNLRHTYATHLYRASGYNLRFVQKQLGHSRIDTTQVYADVLDTDAAKALARPLYGRS